MRERLSTEIKDGGSNDAPVDFNPLDEAVNEKTYTKANVTAAEGDLNKPISEPRFTAPPVSKKNYDNIGAETKKEPVNPEMKNISKKETEMAAAQMAKLILQGYEWGHKMANKGLQVSDKKLRKLEAEGEINLSAMITYDYGKGDITAGEFIKEYNTQVENVLIVSEEFKEEVTPVLERVLSKRGIGLTDEQYLMYLFGQDIAGKTMIFFQQKQQVNYMIEVIKEATMQQQSRFTRRPQPEPQPENTQEEEYDDEEEIRKNFTEAEVLKTEPQKSNKSNAVVLSEAKPKGKRGRRKISRD